MEPITIIAVTVGIELLLVCPLAAWLESRRRKSDERLDQIQTATASRLGHIEQQLTGLHPITAGELSALEDRGRAERRALHEKIEQLISRIDGVYVRRDAHEALAIRVEKNDAKFERFQTEIHDEIRKLAGSISGMSQILNLLAKDLRLNIPREG